MSQCGSGVEVQLAPPAVYYINLVAAHAGFAGLSFPEYSRGLRRVQEST